ncbi:hypothetical protein EDB83DRAFT_314772 [Lactarius deliciosus]|nr:hypothetical protein EDB83DRAFT_314772 [Lactarius deliciosus]
MTALGRRARRTRSMSRVVEGGLVACRQWGSWYSSCKTGVLIKDSKVRRVRNITFLDKEPSGKVRESGDEGWMLELSTVAPTCQVLGCWCLCSSLLGMTTTLAGVGRREGPTLYSEALSRAQRGQDGIGAGPLGAFGLKTVSRNCFPLPTVRRRGPEADVSHKKNSPPTTSPLHLTLHRVSSGTTSLIARQLSYFT